MIKVPDIKSTNAPPLPKMGLADFARFSERCLQSNPRVTAGNCLLKRTDERAMTRPFRLGTSSQRALHASVLADLDRQHRQRADQILAAHQR